MNAIDQVQATYAAVSTAALRAAGATAAPQAVTAPASTLTANARVRTEFVAGPQAIGQTLGADDYVKLVRDRFNSLVKRFDAAKAKGVNMALQFNIEGAGEWYVVIKDGKITVKKGKGGKADATWTGPADVYHKIATGEMNSIFAFLRGKFKVDGDKDLLKKFPEYFRGNDVES